MIWARLALLGTPIWFIAILLVAVFRNRGHVKEAGGVFEFKSRSDCGWSRRKGDAEWVSNVLIEHQGSGLVRTDPGAVTKVTILGKTEPPPKGLDGPALLMEIQTVSADSRVIAVSVKDENRVLGPISGEWRKQARGERSPGGPVSMNLGFEC